MKKYWFKAKEYGYGWYPATWQGWGIFLSFIVFNLWNATRIDVGSNVGSGALFEVVTESLISVVVLLVICYRTGEEARWRWGKK